MVRAKPFLTALLCYAGFGMAAAEPKPEQDPVEVSQPDPSVLSSIDPVLTFIDEQPEVPFIVASARIGARWEGTDIIYRDGLSGGPISAAGKILKPTLPLPSPQASLPSGFPSPSLPASLPSGLPPLPGPRQPFDVEAGEPTSSSILDRVLRGFQAEKVRRVAMDLAKLNNARLGNGGRAFCVGDEPYCRPFNTEGWSGAASDLKKMLVNFEKVRPTDPEGSALIVQTAGGVIGTLRVGVRSFLLRQLANKEFAIVESSSDSGDRNLNDVYSESGDTGAVPVESSLVERNLASNAPPVADEECPNPSESPVVQVLVSVTEKARKKALEKQLDPRSLIDLATAVANVSFEKSAIRGRIEVVRIGFTSYAEKGEFSADIKEFLKPNGELSYLRTERKSTKADVVVLVVEQDSVQNCGEAAGINVDKEKAFVVVNWRCMTDRFSFIHEIGHLAGAYHDPDTVSAQQHRTVVNPHYASGFITPGQNPIATIMAYPSACKRIPCGRHYYWSNPYVTVGGQALGTPTRNFDACVWRRRFPVMAKFDGG